MAALLVLRIAVFHDFGDELRSAGSVKLSGIRQFQEFTLHHNTVGKAVDESALACSVRTGDLDAVVSQRFDNSSDIFWAFREAKDLHLVSSGSGHKFVSDGANNSAEVIGYII
jgi:hypothetical protein